MEQETQNKNEMLKIKGKLHIVLKDKAGNVKEDRLCNTVTSAGKNGLMDQILGSPTLAKPLAMAIGTGTPGSNALGTELSRVTFTSKTRNNNIVTMVGDWAAGVGTGALTEAGVFDLTTLGGNMWCYASFSTINKGANDTLEITWTLSVN